MRQALKLHPDSVCRAVTCIEVEAARPRPRALLLRYGVTGKIDDLLMPPVTTPTRGDELWRRLCFEAFVRPSPGDDYYEFNFSPSTQWAAYRFSGYRNGMGVANEITPQIELKYSAEFFELRAYLQMDPARSLPSAGTWRLGLSAVIEATNGEKSYWALAHAPGKPDFHHADGFALQLPAADQT